MAHGLAVAGSFNLLPEVVNGEYLRAIFLRK